MLQGAAEASSSGTQERGRGAGNGGVRGRSTTRGEITRTRPLTIQSKQGKIICTIRFLFTLYYYFKLCVISILKYYDLTCEKYFLSNL